MNRPKQPAWGGSRISRRRMLAWGLAGMAGVAGGLWTALARRKSGTLQYDESSRPVSALCGDASELFLAQPNTLFSRSTLATADSKTLILRSAAQHGAGDSDAGPFTELPGVVTRMLHAGGDELYVLRQVLNKPQDCYFDVLARGSGHSIRSALLPKVALYMYILRDGALCAWSGSFQLFSTDRGRTWVQLPKTIRGYAYGCGYGDSMFF
jgi:hypothetical protein